MVSFNVGLLILILTFLQCDLLNGHSSSSITTSSSSFNHQEGGSNFDQSSRGDAESLAQTQFSHSLQSDGLADDKTGLVSSGNGHGSQASPHTFFRKQLRRSAAESDSSFAREYLDHQSQQYYQQQQQQQQLLNITPSLKHDNVNKHTKQAKIYKTTLIENFQLNIETSTDQLFENMECNENEMDIQTLFGVFGKLLTTMDKLSMVCNAEKTSFQAYASQNLVTLGYVQSKMNQVRIFKYRAYKIAQQIQSWKQLWARIYTKEPIQEVALYQGLYWVSGLEMEIIDATESGQLKQQHKDRMTLLSFQFASIDLIFRKYFHVFMKNIFQLIQMIQDVKDSNPQIDFLNGLTSITTLIDGHALIIDNDTPLMDDFAVELYANDEYAKQLVKRSNDIKDKFLESKFTDDEFKIALTQYNEEYSKPFSTQPQSLKEWMLRVSNIIQQFVDQYHPRWRAAGRYVQQYMVSTSSSSSTTTSSTNSRNPFLPAFSYGMKSDKRAPSTPLEEEQEEEQMHQQVQRSRLSHQSKQSSTSLSSMADRLRNWSFNSENSNC